MIMKKKNMSVYKSNSYHHHQRSSVIDSKNKNKRKRNKKKNIKMRVLSYKIKLKQNEIRNNERNTIRRNREICIDHIRQNSK